MVGYHPNEQPPALAYVERPRKVFERFFIPLLYPDRGKHPPHVYATAGQTSRARDVSPPLQFFSHKKPMAVEATGPVERGFMAMLSIFAFTGLFIKLAILFFGVNGMVYLGGFLGLIIGLIVAMQFAKT